MQYFEYLFWLTRMAMSALLYYWPVTVALVIPFIIALILRSPFIRSKTKFSFRYFLVFLPLAFALLILIWGTVMKYPDDSQNLAPNWPGYIVLSLFILQLIFGIGVIWFMKGYRWFSVFTIALELWFALACAFVAGMSVSGDWL